MNPMPLLQESAQRLLLGLARCCVTAAAEQGVAPPESGFQDRMPPEVRRSLGGFVSLHAGGMLRGCIGEIEPRRALWKVVREHAVHAAVHDPRFDPVRPEEVPGLVIEISVLSPPCRIDSWEAIEPGRHGVVLHKAGRSAVFLPQVAVEQRWGRATMLAHLALKAGLPSDAWTRGARFEVFEAHMFRETSGTPSFPADSEAGSSEIDGGGEKEERGVEDGVGNFLSP